MHKRLSDLALRNQKSNFKEKFVCQKNKDVAVTSRYLTTQEKNRNTCRIFYTTQNAVIVILAARNFIRINLAKYLSTTSTLIFM